MYWQMTHIWWLFVKELYYMIFGWWIFWANLLKANFILHFPSQNFLTKFIFLRVEITPKYYILTRHVALGETQQSWNNRTTTPRSEWPRAPVLGVSRKF
jgi:hypothetical protein